MLMKRHSTRPCPAKHTAQGRAHDLAQDKAAASASPEVAAVRRWAHGLFSRCVCLPGLSVSTRKTRAQTAMD